MLAAGVPLFLCMPPWNDVTLHDMVARTILRGGVHYRDVFDTNLPGIDWSMAAIRYLFGGSYEVLRAADLVVVGATVAVLGLWVKRCGGAGYAVAWFVAAAALFYPFQSEFTHVQRDPWMLLPAVVAAWLRVRCVSRSGVTEEQNSLADSSASLKPTPPGPPSVDSPALSAELLAGRGKGRGESGIDSSSPSAASGGSVSPLPFPRPARSSADRAGESTEGGPGGGGLANSGRGGSTKSGGVGSSALEGFVWGLAVWVKPHVVVPALAVWVVSAVLIARREPLRRVLADLAGLLLGGVLAGVPGVVWLVSTGAWPYFLDIFLNWNPDYLSEAGSLAARWSTVFDCFRPWSLLHHLALPLAVLALWEARAWSRRPGEPARVRVAPWLYLPAGNERTAGARALLAAMYLAWVAQAVLVQKAFDYVHTPLTFLGMAVIAGQRWCFGFAYLVWFVAVGVLVNAAEAQPSVAPVVRALDPADDHVKFEKHPLADWNVVRLWPRCWSEGGSPELRDKLGQYTNVHCGTRWEELEQVAAFLRTVDPPLGPGELNCWHDSTHPLYLMLDLDPATRYMHYGTAFGIHSKRNVIADEVRASRQRYVVSDLLRTTQIRGAVYEPWPWRDGDPLPAWLPAAERKKFPWNQPVVFRSGSPYGRYVVHKIDPSVPLGPVRVPDWSTVDRLDALGPDE